MKYENLRFPLTTKADIEDMLIRAKRLFKNRQNLQVQNAIAPPRGRQVKNTGKSKKNWNEKGPNSQKRR